MEKILDQFENHHLFRRIIIVILIVMCWHTLVMAFDLAGQASDAIKTGHQLATVIGAMQLILGLVLGHAITLYSKSRMDQRSKPVASEQQ